MLTHEEQASQYVRAERSVNCLQSRKAYSISWECFLFYFAAFAIAGKLDLGIFVTCQTQSTEVYRAAPARGRRKDVRKVDGVCAGIYQGPVRIHRPR
jgi:hypothetical protein